MDISVFLIFILLYIAADLWVVASLHTGTFGEAVKIMLSGNFILNLLVIVLITGIFTGLLGAHLGGFLFLLLIAADSFGNFVKIKYHNDALIPADLTILDEFREIAGDYITLPYRAAIGGFLALAAALIIAFRRQIGAFFMPSFSPVCIVCIVLLTAFYIAASCDLFGFMGIEPKKYKDMSSSEAIQKNGLAVYTLLAFTKDGYAKAPEGYSSDISQEISAYAAKNQPLDKKPNVILILAESLYEADKTPGITYNKPLFKNLEKYKAANAVSPVYGGRTVAAEWESLTGLSNLFLPEGQIAYTAYLNKKNDKIGSIAREFADEGYFTCAVHANDAGFYNRDIVFENMGIGRFYDIKDFELKKDDIMGDGRANDRVFVDKIIEILENKKEPVFMFGASLEGHSPYGRKYEKTDIIASADGVPQNRLDEMSAYGQSARNFDEQMGRLIEYCKNSNEPYLIYIYGDHLPSLGYNMGKEWLNDKYFKCVTPLYAYSNYCDTEIGEEYVSISRIPVEILKHTGIAHRPYFDFIAKVQEKYPVTRRGFVKNENDEMLDLYSRVTWDMTRGKRYLINNKRV